MEQVLKKVDKESVKLTETSDIQEIKEALDYLLYVPTIQLKPKIIEKLAAYLVSKLSNSEYKIKVFIAYQNLEPCGFVTTQIHPTYRSYGRKCGTFGWLMAEDPQVCKMLIAQCEQFIKDNKIRKLRGNVNFPKRFGGLGFQTMGFNEPMMYGIAFTHPHSRVQSNLKELGYYPESEYSCVHVTEFSWEQGRRELDKNIKIRYLTLKEMIARKDEVLNLASGSFYTVFPDGSGGDTGFNEIMEMYRQVPDSFYKLPDDLDPYDYSERPEYRETWDNCDLEKVIAWAPVAFDRTTDKLVGIIFSVPNLYQLWLGEPLTHTNVDTAMVHKEYARKGIFSNLNNIGQITLGFNGVNYVEGTTIWSNNKEAIAAIFPHSQIIRKHQVYQKRI